MEKIKCFGFDMDYTLAGRCSLSLLVSALIAYKGLAAVGRAYTICMSTLNVLPLIIVTVILTDTGQSVNEYSRI